MKKYRIFFRRFDPCASACHRGSRPGAGGAELTCGAAILVDGDHGDVLFEKNGYEKCTPHPSPRS